jgi:hypothetical protein
MASTQGTRLPRGSALRATPDESLKSKKKPESQQADDKSTSNSEYIATLSSALESGSAVPNNPAVLIVKSSVAFRPHLTVGLAFSEV